MSKEQQTMIDVLRLLCLVMTVGLLSACKGGKQAAADDENTGAVEQVFDADSAFFYCGAQCDFGPRAMNTDGHERCKEWIMGKFQEMGCTVQTQVADLKGWDGTMLHSTNIIASVNPEARQRLIICAHWDSRPWADNDPDSTKWCTPIIAANDAASGVAVMMELARHSGVTVAMKTLGPWVHSILRAISQRSLWGKPLNPQRGRVQSCLTW